MQEQRKESTNVSRNEKNQQIIHIQAEFETLYTNLGVFLDLLLYSFVQTSSATADVGLCPDKIFQKTSKIP